MKPSASILNPYAESYIPLAKRERNNENDDSKNMQEQIAAFDSHETEGTTLVDDLKLKGQMIDVYGGILSQSSEEMAKKFIDEESEMDLAYLQMTFPGVSDQSLSAVYSANKGDLEAAVDMLNHLELDTCEFDDLPDVLGIGDAPQLAPPGECSSVEVQNVGGEPSSSSGSSDSTVTS